MSRCARCWAADCLCDRIPRIETKTRFVILRHVWELDKGSNSGRIANLALPNSVIHDIGQKDQPFDPAWIPDGAALLFPDHPDAERPRPEVVIVLDGTWGQARRMLKRNEALWRLPRFHLTHAPDRRRLRTPSFAGQMSTLEAIAQAVTFLEGGEKGEPLDRLYDDLRRAVSPWRA